MSKETLLPVTTAFSGPELIEKPLLNKGTAFTQDERCELKLEGLLPPHFETMEEQLLRVYESYGQQENDLERHIYLRNLQDENETLFYRLMPRTHQRDDADYLHARSRCGL